MSCNEAIKLQPRSVRAYLYRFVACQKKYFCEFLLVCCDKNSLCCDILKHEKKLLVSELWQCDIQHWMIWWTNGLTCERTNHERRTKTQTSWWTNEEQTNKGINLWRTEIRNYERTNALRTSRLTYEWNTSGWNIWDTKDKHITSARLKLMKIEMCLTVTCRGALKYNIKAFSLAVKDLTEAVAIDCKCSLAYFNRAVCYHEMRFFQKVGTAWWTTVWLEFIPTSTITSSFLEKQIW